MLSVPVFLIADLAQDRACADSLLSQVNFSQSLARIVESAELDELMQSKQPMLIVCFGGAQSRTILERLEKKNLPLVKLAIIYHRLELPGLRTLNREKVLSLLDAALPVEVMATRIKLLHARIVEIVEQEASKPSDEQLATPGAFSLRGPVKQTLPGRRTGSIRRDMSSLFSDIPQALAPDEKKSINAKASSSFSLQKTTSSFPPSDSEPPQSSTPFKSYDANQGLRNQLQGRRLPDDIARVLLLEEELSYAEPIARALRTLGLQVRVIAPELAQTNWSELAQFRPHLLLGRDLFLDQRAQVWLQLFASESRLYKTPLISLPSDLEFKKQSTLQLAKLLMQRLPAVREEDAAVSESPREISTPSYHDELDPLKALEKIEVPTGQSLVKNPDSTSRQESTRTSVTLSLPKESLEILETTGPETTLQVTAGDTLRTITKRVSEPSVEPVLAAKQRKRKRTLTALLCAAGCFSALLCFGVFAEFSLSSALLNGITQDVSPQVASAPEKDKTPDQRASTATPVELSPDMSSEVEHIEAKILRAPIKQSSFFLTPESNFADCQSFSALHQANYEQKKLSSAAWRKARQQIVQGDLVKSQKYMCKAVTLNPRSYALEGLARLYLMVEAPSLALEWLNRGLELRPNETKSLQLRSDIFNRLGQTDLALTQLLDLLKVEATDTNSRRYVSKKYEQEAARFYKLGDIQRSEVWYRRSVLLDPKNEQAAAGLALLFVKKQLYPFAKHWANLALQINRKSVEAHLALAELALQEEASVEAQQHLQIVEALKPRHPLLWRAQAKLNRLKKGH